MPLCCASSTDAAEDAEHRDREWFSRVRGSGDARREIGRVLKNTYVRIAFIIVLVILLYYLVITLARSVATGGDAQMPPAGSERLGDPAPTRESAGEPR